MSRDPAHADADSSPELQEFVDAICASPKYRTVAPALVAALAAEELAKRSKRKDALKAVKNKLHQVAAVYVDVAPPYAAWLDALHAAAPDSERLRTVCTEVMARHASTRERLPILAQFYAALFDGLPPVRRVADLACGFNSLALPWMGLPAGASYYACDVFADQVAFLNRCWEPLGVRGRAEVCDLAHAPACPAVDVALLLKTLPTLEQIDKQASRRLLDMLDALDTPVVIVSYPVHSLGGRRKGMPDHYAAHFEALAAGRAWRVERLDFPAELVFRVFTSPHATAAQSAAA